MNNERRKRIAEIVSALEELHSRAEEIAKDAANSMQEALDYYGGIEL